MRLESKAFSGERTVADFAEAARQGTARVRELISPITPTLWTFVSRRTEDAEDAEDALVETLQKARANTDSEGVADTPLLPWLLGLALESLSPGLANDDRDEESGALEAGLKPNRVVPAVHKPPWLVSAVSRLPRVQRLALGMRFGDALPPEIIAGVLGTDVAGVSYLVDSALTPVQSLCCPDERIARMSSSTLDEYISDLIAGAAGSRPAEVGPGLQTLLDSLLSTRATVTPAVAQEARVWRRYENEREVVFTGRVLPRAPGWAPPLALVVALLVLLAGVALYVILRQRSGEPPRVIAGTGTATSSADDKRLIRLELQNRPPLANPVAPPVGSSTLGSFPARLFLQQQTADGGVVLEVMDMDRPSTGRARQLRTVLAQPQKHLRYTLSPSGSRVAYSTGDSVWLQGIDGGPQRVVYALKSALVQSDSHQLDRRVVPVQVAALAWHPRGDSLAVVSAPKNPAAVWPLALQMVRLDGRIERTIDFGEAPSPGVHRTGTVLTASSPDLRGGPITVSGVSWSPDGNYLGVMTSEATLIVDLQQKPPDVRRYPPVRKVAWSPEPAGRRVFWIGGAPEGRNATMGVATMGGGATPRMVESVGDAVWRPDGKSIVLLRFTDGPGAESDFWRHDVATGAETRLRGVPGLTVSARNLQLAPDGRRVAYELAGELYMADYTTGRVERLPDPGDSVVSMRWAQSGTAYTRQPPGMSEGGAVLYLEAGLETYNSVQRLIALDLESGGRVELARGKALSYAVSPRGASVAVADGASLSLLDLATGERRQLSKAGRGGKVFGPAWSPSGADLMYLRQERTALGQGPLVTNIWSVRVADGKHRALMWGAYSPMHSAISVKYSPSGRWLLVASELGWSLLAPDGAFARHLPPAERYEWAPKPRAGRRPYDSSPGIDIDSLLQVQDSRRAFRRRNSVPRSRPRARPPDRILTVVNLEGKSLVDLPEWAIDGRWRSSSEVLLVNPARELFLYDVIARKSTLVAMLPEWDSNLPLPSWDPWPEWGEALSTQSPTGEWVLASNGRYLWATDISTKTSAPGRKAPVWVSSEDFGILYPSWIAWEGALDKLAAVPSTSASGGHPEGTGGRP